MACAVSSCWENRDRSGCVCLISFMSYFLFFFNCYGPSGESKIEFELHLIVFATAAATIKPRGNPSGGKVEKLSFAT